MALVWSSGVGRVCPACGKAEAACRCPRRAREAASGRGAPGGPKARTGPSTPQRSPGKVVVRLEKKGRAGKLVTVIEGLPLDATALAAAAKELKRRSGAGGTTRDGAIELQGDQLRLAEEWLRERSAEG